MHLGQRHCDCEALRDEIQRLQSQNHDREERADQERQRRRREQEERRKEEMRSASDWPEAFQKQRALIGPELRFSERELAATKADQRYTDAEEKARDVEFWTNDVAGMKADLAAIATADSIYREEAKKAEEEIAAIRKRMLDTVAKRIEENLVPHNSRGFISELVDHMREGDPAGWLNW